MRLNDGNGSFGAAVSYGMESMGSKALFLADLNGDSAVDLVTAGAGGGGRATVRLNDGSGSFGAAVSYATEGTNSNALFLTDINGDGAADLITAGWEAGKGGAAVATVRINDGSGRFGSAVSFSMDGTVGYGVAVADLNGDGAPDLAVAGSHDSDAQVLVRTAIAHDVTTIARIDLSTREKAREALTLLENQQNRISSERGSIGSFQRRLSVALNTLGLSCENSKAAGARITNTDMAQEASELVRNQILQQSGAAVLAQAGRQPSLALQLLRV